MPAEHFDQVCANASSARPKEMPCLSLPVQCVAAIGLYEKESRMGLSNVLATSIIYIGF